MNQVARGEGSLQLLVLGCRWMPEMDGAAGGGHGEPAIGQYGNGANVALECRRAGDELASFEIPGVDSTILTPHEDEGLWGVDGNRAEGHLLVGFGETAQKLVGVQVEDAGPVSGPHYAGSLGVEFYVAPDGGAAKCEFPELGCNIEHHHLALAADRQESRRGGMKANRAVVCFVVAKRVLIAWVGD